VWVEDQLDGTSRMEAVGGTPDVTAFDTALSGMAATMAALGDTDPLQVRRAKAIGILADPQYALDLTATLDQAADAAQAADQPTAVLPRRTTTGGSAPTLHIHVHTTANSVRDGAPSGSAPVEPVARVTGGGATPGARATAAVEQWLTDLTPGTTVTVTPVVDLNRRYAVNAYEVPDRLRAQIDHRDDGCRFPWCGRAGRYDLDHIQPYQWTDPDNPEPGTGDPPPGQTSTDNLARLCRFHHRVKTHAGWTYRREYTHPDDPGSDVLRWTSPLGRHYTVDETGTYPQH
jgi:hypothetical protein